MRWSRLRRHTFVCLEMIAIVALLSPAHRLNQPLQMAFQKSQADRWRCDREGREGGNVTTGAISAPPSYISGVGYGFGRRNRLRGSTSLPVRADFSGARPV